MEVENGSSLTDCGTAKEAIANGIRLGVDDEPSALLQGETDYHMAGNAEAAHPDMLALESLINETPEEEATWCRVRWSWDLSHKKS